MSPGSMNAASADAREARLPVGEGLVVDGVQVYQAAVFAADVGDHRGEQQAIEQGPLRAELSSELPRDEQQPRGGGGDERRVAH